MKPSPCPRLRRRAALAAAVAAAALTVPRPARAGPPFLTDDPEPVERGHWELYLASQWDVGRDAQAGTLPHIEVNYGALPRTQLHLIVPAVFAHAGGDSAYGLGDVELGAKVRFVTEGTYRPQIGAFPLVLLPTGSESRGLGGGSPELFAPIWLQKSIGDWLTYGGGGVRVGPEPTDLELGWLIQRQLTHPLALGAEVYLTIPTGGGAVRTQLDAGAVIDLGEHSHILLSVGPSFGQNSLMQAYAAYLATLD